MQINCSVEPIQTDLSKINQSLDTLVIDNNITGQTYQISPDISSYQKLYIGDNWLKAKLADGNEKTWSLVEVAHPDILSSYKFDSEIPHFFK